MLTNCECCCAEIEDCDVNRCEVCLYDGLCDDCLDGDAHDCAGSPPELGDEVI